MANPRVGGTIFFKSNGKQFSVAGEFTYNLGKVKRDAVVGHDGVHGFKELPQAPMMNGQFTDNYDMDLENDLLNITDETLTLELNNGKTIVMRNGFYTGSGDVTTEEGKIVAEFSGLSCVEIK